MTLDSRIHGFFLLIITVLTIFILCDIHSFIRKKEKWYLLKIIAWTLILIIIFVFMFTYNTTMSV